MDFVYFAQTIDNIYDEFKEHCHFFDDVNKLLSASLTVDFILIGEIAHEHIHSLCHQLRCDKHWALVPIFTFIELPPLLEALIDAKVADLTEAKTRADDIQNYNQTLPEAMPDDIDSALLRLLYTRQANKLVAIRDWQSPELYRYPIAELFHEMKALWQWLGTLRERKLLGSTTLIDRIRLCPTCNTGHLNYVDACPNCHSIRIEHADFYHCFTCGYVGEQKEFIQGQQLICPRCHAMLKHIGSDYDRPLEEYHCLACNQNFLEAEVSAECLQCETKSDPENLVVVPIYEYELTQLAKISVINNTVVDIYAVLDHLNFIIPQYFDYWLNWYLQMAARYTTHHFALMLIKIDKVDELTQHYGYGFTHQLIEGVAERLRELIRTTDLTTRTSTQLLWLLLPETNADGCEVLIKRLQAISESTKQSDDEKVIFNIGYLLSTELDLTKEQAQPLMQQLEDKLTT